MKIITVGITGASGSIYGLRLIEELAKQDIKIHVIISSTAQKVIPFETGKKVDTFIDQLKSKGANVVLEDVNNFFSSVASGSYKTDGMVIAPCSMGTLAAISNGISSSLMMRAADVCLKERRPLILLARETPLNTINLENMLKITRAGGIVMPASPGFYSKPVTLEDAVDFMVGKMLDALKIEHQLYRKWETT